MLPSGTANYVSSGVSADGSIVVGVSAGRPFRWTSATGLQALVVLPGFPAAAAEGVSADGGTIVGRRFDPAAMTSSAFGWTAAGGMQDLGALPGGTGVSIALAASGDGSVIVGGADYANSFAESKSFIWTSATGMQDVGITGNSFANGVSDDGSVIVGFANGTAYRWTAANGLQDLGTLPGFTSSVAEGVSADGTVVVGSAFNDGQSICRAFRWSQSTGMQEIAVVPGAVSSCALAVSADGSYVAGYSEDATGAFTGYRWSSTEIGARYCTPVANSTGRPALMNLQGSALVADNNVTLTAEFLPPNQFGFFLGSMTQGFDQQPGGSQGNLCLDGQIARFDEPSEIANAGPSGTFSIPIDLTVIPGPMGLVSVMAGETWNFQAWYRDVNPGAVSNFTDAISVTFN